MIRYIVLAFFFSSSLLAQDTIRVVSWNALALSANTFPQREQSFRNVLASTEFRNIDLFLLQEVESAEGLNLFRSALPSTYATVTFNDGPDSDNGCVFNPTRLRFLRANYITTELRNIAEYQFATQTNDTVYAFSVHLKANDTSTDATQRGREIANLVIRLQQLPRNALVLIAGDYNIYNTSESAYTQLSAFTSDPLGRNWLRNDTRFLNIYTQSTRLNLGGCAGGASGGVDDRFDLILPSPNWRVTRYSAFGNDSLDRRNAAINSPANRIVSSTTADALLCASDHLPVIMHAIPQRSTSVRSGGNSSLKVDVQDNIAIIVPTNKLDEVVVYDVLGNVVAREIGTVKVTLRAGVYFARTFDAVEKFIVAF